DEPDTNVVIGRGVIDVDPVLPPREGRQAVALVTQPGRPETIAEAIGTRLRDEGLRSVVLVLEDRDQAKTLAQLDSAYAGLHDFGLTRHDTIVAVGGGAATDVGGFLAATYLRGVESVYVSTTLLGAVDASIGGKTGINHGAKNMVGAFWHPRRVVIDLDVLDALPEPVRREGFAEAVKTGFIGDPVIVDLCERYGLAAPLDEIVPRSVRVKAEVVSNDFREGSSRAFLNYGHTIGHAVEIAAGLSHGYAVGVGMIAAAAVSESVRGFAGRARHDAVIVALGLPTSAPGVPAAAAEELIGSDKKRDGAGTRMVLLDRIGVPVLVPVSEADVATGMRAIGIHA
ncbi:MAG: 3-dehydroquinate synthase, partial [Acidimicrobiia bacterium]|nr:3-dehydroquinate synthase [Acidimicrobiia bacterium]